MLKRIYFPLRLQTRKCSTATLKKVKLQTKLDERTEDLMKKDEMKPRKHPGVVHRKVIPLPEWVPKAMKLELEDYPIQDMMNDGRRLYQYLNGRHAPLEKNTIENKFNKIVEKLTPDSKYENQIPAENEVVENSVRKKALGILKREVYHWIPIQYDKYSSLMYMVGRGAQDYAILYKIFSEINSRDEKFEPQTLFDFGSGIGTVAWAANQFWSNSLKEHICVDISTEISDLAESLAKHADPPIKRVFHRQYLPVSPLPTCDIVVSAFTFMELPDRKTRMDTLFNLWKKTEKYLIIVEQGTTAGFRLMYEAREFFLYLWENTKEQNPTPGHIFSPCPHEFRCPRVKADDSPCNFEASYFQLSFRKQLIPRRERYSYIVIKKGVERDEKEMWPRIVRPVIVRSRRSICRMCTPDGKLEEIIFSAGKHERPVFYCARSSKWGDRLPMKISSSEEE